MKKLVVLFICCSTMLGFANAQSVKDVQKAIDNEQFERAKSFTRSLINAAATQAQGHYFLGDIYLKTGETDSARLAFQSGISTNPKYSLNHIGIGKVLLQEGKLNEAATKMQEAIDISGDKDYLTFLVAGQALVDAPKKNLPLAKTYLDKALSLNNKDPYVFSALGDYYLELEDGSKAVSNYEAARNVNKAFVYSYVREGNIYKRAYNYQASIESINKAIEIDPNYAPAYRELAELYFRSGQLTKAIDTYKNQYMSRTDASCNSQRRYAEFLFLAKDYENAIQEIQKQINTCDARPVMYRLLGYSQYEKGELSAAENSLTKFFKLQPQDKVLFSDFDYLVKTQIKLGKDSLALKTVQDALLYDPSNTDLNGIVGEIQFRARNFPAAVAAYEKKFAGNTKFEPVDNFFYGQALYFDKQYLKADVVFSNLIKEQPNFINHYLYKGRIQATLNADNGTYAAKEFYSKVIQLGETDVNRFKRAVIEAHKYMGDYYFNTKNMCKAKATWQLILELEPTDEQAKQVLASKEMASVTPCSLTE